MVLGVDIILLYFLKLILNCPIYTQAHYWTLNHVLLIFRGFFLLEYCTIFTTIDLLYILIPGGHYLLFLFILLVFKLPWLFLGICVSILILELAYNISFRILIEIFLNSQYHWGGSGIFCHAQTLYILF